MIGNVGKPGITLLIPPLNPMVKSRDPASWRYVSTNEFNGAAEDHFTHTSLHLSFTNYYAPLTQAGRRQGQDHHVFLRESIVSVYHSGEWIGDLDVLKSLDSGRLHRIPHARCSCSQSQASQELALLATSVESWEDVLDPPSEGFVVRAHGNWVARLATASMLIQVMPEDSEAGITILPSDVCWRCCPWAACVAPDGRVGTWLKVPAIEIQDARPSLRMVY